MGQAASQAGGDTDCDHPERLTPRRLINIAQTAR